MLGKTHRLRNSLRIRQIRSSRPSWANRWLALNKLTGEQATSRFAFSVSRRIGNAVTRNRVKRLLRESVRRHLPEMTGIWDVVLIARQPIHQASFAQIHHAVIDLLSRAELVQNRDRGQQESGQLGLGPTGIGKKYIV